MVAGLLGLTIMRTSPVKGTISPSNAGIRAWLFSRTDTLSGSIAQGAFQIDQVKPGNYRLMIEAAPPFRNLIVDGVVVVEGQPTDVGVLTMVQ